jgi:hypothetical protein
LTQARATDIKIEEVEDKDRYSDILVVNESGDVFIKRPEMSVANVWPMPKYEEYDCNDCNLKFRDVIPHKES